jgi:hypothetical protein
MARLEGWPRGGCVWPSFETALARLLRTRAFKFFIHTRRSGRGMYLPRAAPTTLPS